MAERKSKKRKSIRWRTTSAVSDQASVATRTQMPSPGFTSASTTASPMSSRSSATTASRRSSVGGASSTGASSVVGASSANDDRLLALLALPAGGHVLV